MTGPERESLRSEIDAIIAKLVAEAVAIERERCAEIVHLADPVTTSQNDSAGGELEVIDWARTAEMLERRIREGTEGAR